MDNRTLVLTFINLLGKKVRVNISPVRENILKDEVTALMDKIITTNVLTFQGVGLKEKVEAQIVDKSVEKIDYSF
ncbi:DUF2922 domain-containing protein [Clostridium hydrogeniformans]|uniref:DUF2922 domain-containing protein n=1 Tax=Clostridium hydrogeniformans TaxID=349933 RepID=UPI00047F1914|nr:DUF2922 domain-containing protein [Clostridium hydrogeniformans]